MEKTSNKQIKVVLLLVLVSLILSKIVIPIIIFGLYNEEQMENPLVTLLAQVIGYVIPICYVLYKTDNVSRQKSFFSIEKLFNKVDLKQIFIAVMFGCVIFVCTKFFGIFLENSFIAITGIISPYEASNVDFGGFLLLIFVFAIMPSLIEETFHRGILLQAANNRMTAMLLTIVPFALLHLGFINVGTAFVFAIMIFFVYEKTNNIVILYIIHVVHNMLSLIFANFIILPIEIQGVLNNIYFIDEMWYYAFIALSVTFIALIGFVLLQPLLSRKDRIYNVVNIDKRYYYSIVALIIFLYIINAILKYVFSVDIF